ncbi:MAG: glycerol-3-phosphate dehydrogenase/oxidase [Acidobacteria bacterium]|nr:glycerol-3-phosphate dehydrogenase/oxidase [Acidobacteriota bacterium]
MTKTTPYDLIIIGGGILGAGVAHASARRGLRVLLLEQSDFASGTTSRSTKLIHGGLRYLEHGDLGLVRESLRERNRLLQSFPHQIHPLPFLVVVHRQDRRWWRMIKLGMLIYDWLSRDSLPPHHRATPDEIMQHAPFLDQDQLRGAFLYWDCQTLYPERLCLDLILEAQRLGARVCNYARVLELERKGSAIGGARWRDLRTGEEHRTEASLVVNASGPWLDQVCKMARPDSPTRLRASKGSHLVVSQERLPLRSAVYASSPWDQRMFFLVPWKSAVLIGTTEVPFDGDPGEARTEESEVHYLLQSANRLIRGRALKQEDILYTYAGIRPLPASERGSLSSLSRRHQIHDHQAQEGVQGLVSVLGGKITTFWQAGEEVADLACRKLGAVARPSLVAGLIEARRVGNAVLLLGKLRGAAQGLGLEEETLLHLVELYGPRAADLLQEVRMRGGGSKLCRNQPVLEAQIRWSMEREQAVTLADIFLRRTAVGLLGCRGLDCAERAARLMGARLGWEETRVQKEVQAYVAELQRACPAPIRR